MNLPEPAMIFPVVAKDSPWTGYSEAQMRQHWNDALEAAAEIAERNEYGTSHEAIRALKEANHE